MILFVPFDNVDNGIGFPVFFDKSIDTDCGLKFTVGREITTRDGDGDETVSTGFKSSAKKKQEIFFFHY